MDRLTRTYIDCDRMIAFVRDKWEHPEHIAKAYAGRVINPIGAPVTDILALIIDEMEGRRDSDTERMLGNTAVASEDPSIAMARTDVVVVLDGGMTIQGTLIGEDPVNRICRLRDPVRLPMGSRAMTVAVKGPILSKMEKHSVVVAPTMQLQEIYAIVECTDESAQAWRQYKAKVKAENPHQ